MPLMYSSLNERQKCMYHAFGRTENIPKGEWGARLGKLVTDQGCDADDSKAALIFAKTFGFDKAIGCDGKKLKEFIRDVPESCWYVILVLEQYKKGGKEFKPPADYFTGSVFRDVTVLLNDPAWEYLEWHAIVCEVDVLNGNRTIAWYDDQESRYHRNGPDNGKYCIFFGRWKAAD